MAGTRTHQRSSQIRCWLDRERSMVGRDCKKTENLRQTLVVLTGRPCVGVASSPSELAFVFSRGGGEAENSWTRNYPTKGLPVSTTSVCLRFSVFLQSRPTIHCVRPSIVLYANIFRGAWCLAHSTPRAKQQRWTPRR